MHASLSSKGLKILHGVVCPLYASGLFSGLLNVWVKESWEGCNPINEKFKERALLYSLSWNSRICSLGTHWEGEQTGTLFGVTLTPEPNFFPGASCVFFFLSGTPWVHKSSCSSLYYRWGSGDLEKASNVLNFTQLRSIRDEVWPGLHWYKRQRWGWDGGGGGRENVG